MTLNWKEIEGDMRGWGGASVISMGVIFYELYLFLS